MLIMTVTNSDKSSVSVATRLLLKVNKKTFQQKCILLIFLGAKETSEVKINGGVGDLC